MTEEYKLMNIEKLENCIKYKFRNKQLIIEALTHKSYQKNYNYERLEFLGDAVLDLIVGEYLYTKFQDTDEGKLSKMRASLVNEEGFEKLARHVKLGDFIFMSLAEENNNGRGKPSLLSSSFEALIGAMYLESGLATTNDVVVAILEEVYPIIDMKSLFRDYKTTLQEITQAEYGNIPEYILVQATGPDHLKEFEISVHIQDKEISRAKGNSKKKAEQEAAKLALDSMGKSL